jgi:hypothetical protein
MSERKPKPFGDVPFSHRDIPMPPVNIPKGTHSWANYYSDEAPYICYCGQEFDEHQKLMDHTAEANPTITESYELGRAGVAIERTAHEETLKKFNKALDFIEEVRGEQAVSFPWYDETTEFLKECGREVDNIE